MKRFWLFIIAFSFVCVAAALAQVPSPPGSSNSSATAQETPDPAVTILRELHGVKLDMTRDEVRDQLHKPSLTATQLDEYKLEGGDILTVRYSPEGKVSVIQLYCTDTKRAPVWTQVIGDAQVQEHPNGAKSARKDVSNEKFWVTMYQSKSGDMTTITISRHTG